MTSIVGRLAPGTIRQSQNQLPVLSWKMLTAAHGTDLHFPLMLALFTGMRRGELIALRWQDVDFQGKKLYVRHSIVSVQGVPEMKGPKTESGKREIALSDRIIDLLKEQLDRFPRSEYVVCQKNGQPFSPDAFSRKFQRFLSRNHLPHLRLHDLRHPYVKHTTKNISLQKQKSQAINRF